MRDYLMVSIVGLAVAVSSCAHCHEDTAGAPQYRATPPPYSCVADFVPTAGMGSPFRIVFLVRRSGGTFADPCSLSVSDGTNHFAAGSLATALNGGPPDAAYLTSGIALTPPLVPDIGRIYTVTAKLVSMTGGPPEVYSTVMFYRDGHWHVRPGY